MSMSNGEGGAVKTKLTHDIKKYNIITLPLNIFYFPPL